MDNESTTTYWNIRGQRYDLTPFLDRHPGGKDILASTRGIEDLTPLFETYHAFSDKTSIDATLAKYRVVTTTTSPSSATSLTIAKQYSFASYHALVDELKKTFPDRAAIKATTRATLQNAASVIAYSWSFYVAMYSSSHGVFAKCGAACIAGLLFISLGFNVMHDASHYGVSIHPRINEELSFLWNAWAWWNSKVWFYHHVVHHHSFTGETKKDPDMYHLRPFANKVVEEEDNDVKDKEREGGKRLVPKTLLQLHHPWTHPFLMMILVIFIPGLHIGQSIQYLRFLLGGAKTLKLFSVPLLGTSGSRSSSSSLRGMVGLGGAVLMAVKLYSLYRGFFLPAMFYMASLNLWYSINIVLDHDSFETAVTNHYDGDDWLKMQVCNSGNFLNGNALWTRAFGAINFQIEHHLFPNMSNEHYATIAPVVRRFCAQHHIPYVHHASLFAGLASWMKMISSRNRFRTTSSSSSNSKNPYEENRSD